MKTLFIILSILFVTNINSQLYVTSGYTRLDNKYDCLIFGITANDVTVSINTSFDYPNTLHEVQRVAGLNIGYGFPLPWNKLKFNAIASINGVYDVYKDTKEWDKLIPDLLIGFSYTYNWFMLSVNKGVRTDLNIMLGIKMK